MIIEHGGKSPRIDESAYVAPNATVCGDVEIGPGARIMFGACVVAEGGRIEIGAECVVLENAVVRSTARFSTSIGASSLVGPGAHLVGCTLENEVFVATGAAIFHGARLGTGSEVRVRGVVHVGSVLEAGETVPIGWVAVGVPAQLLAPDRHEEIWALQAPLNFPRAAYGLEREEADMRQIARRLSEALAGHADDVILS